MTKDDFDIQPGMSVYGSNGVKIGTISHIAGFGSTRIHGVSEQQADGLATQASSGTGYVKVDQTDVLGSGADELTVPFNRISTVKSGYGITLHDAPAVAAPDAPPIPVPASGKRWWQMKGSGKNA